MALGFADWSATVNKLVTQRIAPSEFSIFYWSERKKARAMQQWPCSRPPTHASIINPGSIRPFQ